MAKRWPTMTDYQEAVQAPQICFADAQLKGGIPGLNKLGLPRPICGMFASVYEIEGGGSKWAIKCFLRNIPDLHSRYAKIAKQIKSLSSPYFVSFDYLQKGIRIHGDFYPIVKMKWEEGVGLNEYVESHVNDKATLVKLEASWLELLASLLSANVAHGDLQHGNVLVAADGSLKLIDYDGMWVPKLKGQGSHETGHPDYQSPHRTGQDFHEGIDQFAGEVIFIAIRALQHNPGLWAKYNNADNMLFKRGDYLDPANSVLFNDLRGLGDQEINTMLEGLIDTCAGKPKRGPSKFFNPNTAKQAAPAPAPAPAPAAAPAAQAAPPPPPPPKAAPAPPPPPKPAPPPTPAKAAPAPPRPAPVQASGPAWMHNRVTGAAPSSAAVPAATAAPPRAAPKPAPKPAPAPVRAAPAPAPAPAAPPKAAPAPAAVAPVKRSSAPPISWGPWLLSQFRLVLHVLLLSTTGWITFEAFRVMSSEYPDQTAAMLLGGFGLTVLLGLTSLVTIFLGRRIHPAVSKLFFGMTIFMVSLAVFAALMI
ncbi:MAG: hypothetical protein V3S08_06795, partial [Phycisphaerales bacterium]